VLPLQRLWQPDLAPPSPAGLFFGRHGRRRDVAPDLERDRAAAGEGADGGEKVH
jgi:hypothetical protein